MCPRLISTTPVPTKLNSLFFLCSGYFPVFRICTFCGRPVANSLGVGCEFRPRSDVSHHHSPAQSAADDQIGGGKMIAEEEWSFLDCLGYRVQYEINIAPTDRTPVAWLAL